MLRKVPHKVTVVQWSTLHLGSECIGFILKFIMHLLYLISHELFQNYDCRLHWLEASIDRCHFISDVAMSTVVVSTLSCVERWSCISSTSNWICLRRCSKDVMSSLDFAWPRSAQAFSSACRCSWVTSEFDIIFCQSSKCWFPSWLKKNALIPTCRRGVCRSTKIHVAPEAVV